MVAKIRKGNSRRSGRKKTIAKESKPVIGIAIVLDPVQVGLALGLIPPNVAHVLVTLEGIVSDTACTTAH